MAYLPFQTSAGILQEMPAKGITLFLILLNFGWWMRMCCLRRSRSRTRPTIKITTPAPGWGSWMRGRKTSEPTGTELSAPRTPATVDAESNTTTTLAMLSLLEDMKKSIDNSLQEHQAKSASTLAAAVKKEIAGLLNQRPPASVADIKAVSLEIQNVRSELDMVRSELTEMKKVLSDTHQSTLDARVEAKTEVDRLENTFISYDAKFDSEMAYINQRLDELHVKVDKTKDDIRDIHMIVPYQQNIQRVVDDILWHAEQISHGCRQMDESVGKALENTRLVGEAHDELCEYVKEALGELLSRLLPATSTSSSRPSQAHMPPPQHHPNTGSGQASSDNPSQGTGQVPINLTSALRFKAPPATPPPSAPAPVVYGGSCARPLPLTAEDLARLIMVVQQSQAALLGSGA